MLHEKLIIRYATTKLLVETSLIIPVNTSCMPNFLIFIVGLAGGWLGNGYVPPNDMIMELSLNLPE